ncbi:MAG: phenylalanine--tRNA ligase subunit alpha [Candidatus Helarchaeota archaeon]|nr:phenylalanine--tRNA ligase subunit alpha [Candidatus Helarchaeota archaeon]
MSNNVLAVSEAELKILKSLKKLGGKASPEQIADHANLPLIKVKSSKSFLWDKGLIDFKDSELKNYFATKEGINYGKTDLPEIQLVNFLKNNPKSNIQSMNKKINRQILNIGIKWAKKKNWISTIKEENETKFNLTKSGEKIKLPIESKILKTFSSADISHTEQSLFDEFPSLNTDISPLTELIKRNLVESKTKIQSVFLLKDFDFNKLTTKQITKLTRDEILSDNWKNIKIKSYNVSSSPPVIYPGKKQPYLELLDEVREILVGMGFQEEIGPIVEAEFFNFDALFQAQDHPAREIHDSYILKFPQVANLKRNSYITNVEQTHVDGWKTGSIGWGSFDFELSMRLILRTQTTAVSIRKLIEVKKPPIRMFCLDKVFRPDVLDAKHAVEFHQLEGIVLGENLNLRHLLGVLSQFGKELGFEDIKFKPGYFPFTCPSVEAFVKHPKLGWIEILGSGLFRPEVLIPLGIDYPKVQCIAFGIGIGRLAMIRLGLDDIRELHSQKLNYLRNTSIVISKKM